jgi:UDP-glucose 4-epimerase
MSCWSRSGLRVRLGLYSLPMRILIAGGFGFVGGRLAVHLAQAGHSILLGSRKNLTAPTWLPQAEVAQIAWDDTVALACSCSNVDVVIQAAGMNAQECATNPAAALGFNGVATARLVAAASGAGVRRFIYLSTAHVYANPLVGSITEETCPRNLHPYATSHLAGEHAVMSASQRGEIEGIVLRISNAFGAPMDKDVNCWMLLVNDLCRQAVQTRKLMLKTSGAQQRDFIALTEVCRMAEHLALGNGVTIQVGVFNVGAGMSQSVIAMAQLIQQRCVQILGFEPVLQRVEGGACEMPTRLTYRADNLVKTGVTISLDNTAEVDSLLRFCQSAFTQTQSSTE